MPQQDQGKGESQPGSKTGSSIATRFRNDSLLLFTLAFFIFAVVMYTAFGRLVSTISKNFASNYALSTAEVLSAHISKEIGLMSKAARSGSVIAWLQEESDPQLKSIALEELAEIVSELYSANLYVGIGKSSNEYQVERNLTPKDFVPFATLREGVGEDSWYYECLASDSDYMLSVNFDFVLDRKRVWLDYKVIHEGEVLGVICTGLEFSHLSGELFAKYESVGLRGFIIAGDGQILMDSAKIRDDSYLYGAYSLSLQEQFSDPLLLASLQSHLQQIEGFFTAVGDPKSIAVHQDAYRHASITPVRLTEWTAVVLSNPNALLDIGVFLPVAVAVLALLIAFALSISAVNYNLIFQPLSKLEQSLGLLRENRYAPVYGTDRSDELGNLSRTISELFLQANVDPLTGLYNRRFMENTLRHIMPTLSRANGSLSLMMLDIDFFKRFNDTYGHDQGDVCLKEIARVLTASVSRASDFVARYGGEEFVIVLPYTDAQGALVVAEKVLESVRSENIPHAHSEVAPYVTISIGITTGKVAHWQRWEEFLRKADEALYESKNNGRDRCTAFPLEEES